MGAPTSDARTPDLARRAGTEPAAWDELVARFSLTVKAAVTSHWLTDEQQVAVTQHTWTALAQHLADEEEPLGSLGLWLSLTAHAECLRLTSGRARTLSRASSVRGRDRRSRDDRRRGSRSGQERRRQR